MKKVCSTCGESKEANRSKESGFAWRAERNTYYSNCKACLLIYNNNKAKERRRLIALKERETIGEDPHGHLAADIVALAIQDLRTEKTDEVLAFFASDWFEELCDACGVAPDYARKHIGV